MSTGLVEPIIFIGMGRSGTTVLSEAVFRHPDLAWPSNYQEYFPHLSSINLLRNLWDNPYWKITGQKKQLHKVSRFNTLAFKPTEGYKMWDMLAEPASFSQSFLRDFELEESRITSIRKYFSKMVVNQGRSRLALKITGPSRISFLQQLFPDAFFIDVYRDPLPTIASYLKVPFWKDKGYDKLWWSDGFSAAEQDWANQNKNSPALLMALHYFKVRTVLHEEKKKLKPKMIQVSYTEFTANPKETLKRILQHTQLGYHKDVYDYVAKNKIVNRDRKANEYSLKEDVGEIVKIATTGI